MGSCSPLRTHGGRNRSRCPALRSCSWLLPRTMARGGSRGKCNAPPPSRLVSRSRAQCSDRESLPNHRPKPRAPRSSAVNHRSKSLDRVTSHQDTRSSLVRNQSIFASWTPNGPRFLHRSNYSLSSQEADCVQRLPSRINKLLTNNWSVRIMVDRLDKKPKTFRLATGIPQMIRCDKSVSPRQVVNWSTSPIPVILGHPRNRRYARTVSQHDIRAAHAIPSTLEFHGLPGPPACRCSPMIPFTPLSWPDPPPRPECSAPVAQNVARTSSHAVATARHGLFHTLMQLHSDGCGAAS